MSQRPMHTVPGLFDRLAAIYADGERALAEGRFPDAVARFTEGLGLDDHFRQRYVTMYAQRGFALQRLGDHRAALDDYTMAIAMEPPINQAQYHFHRGMCHAALGQLEDAVADYARSSELHPDHPGPYHLRGKLLCCDLGRPAEALLALDQFLARRPHPEGYQLRGYARLQLGDGAGAIPDLVESARLAPSPYTHYLLAWAGAIAPDDELCLRSIEQAMRADPSYRTYFVDHPDFARVRATPRFHAIVGAPS